MPQGNIQIRPVSAREWCDAAGDLPQPRTLDTVVVIFRHRGRRLRRVVVSDAPLEGSAIVQLARQVREAA